MKRILTLLLTAAIMLCLSVSSLAAKTEDDYQDELDELSAKYSELEEQQKAAQAEIDKVKNEKDKQLAQKQQIDTQISGTRQQISILNDKIDVLENNISEQQSALDEKENELKENYSLLKERLRAMYKSGSATTLGLILGSENVSEFLSRTQVASRIASHDKELLLGLYDELNEIKELKAGIEADKEEVESVKSEQASKQVVLTEQLAETQDMIEDLEALEKQYTANKATIDAAMKQAQSEIDAIYAALDPDAQDYDGGKMFWPVTGYSTITSYYGWRFNGTDFHTGVDIAGQNSAGTGIYGQPIRAAANGTVIFTRTTYVNGYSGGYGIYCMLDNGYDENGNRITTLYAHCSGLAVQVGDTVSRGQVIGYVGSTGWSTGPHLHFEVRVNGTHTNPLPYLK